MKTYQEVLKLVDYPETCLVIDFETFYDQEYSLSKMSTIEYVCHRLFDFTGMGYQILSDPVIGDFKPFFAFKPDIHPYINALQDSFGLNFNAATVIFKNAKFDATILKEKFNILPRYIIDIDDLLRHYDARMSHRMKDVTEMFGLKPKGKTENFKGLHYEDMDQKTKNVLRDYGINDVEIESNLFKILLPLLMNPVMEIPLARHTLDLYLRPRIQFDFKLAKNLQGKMQEKIDNIITEVGVSKTALSGNISFMKLLKAALPENEGVPMKLGKRGNIPAFAQQDDGCKWLLSHSVKEVRDLMKARQLIKSWPLHIKRIQNMIDQSIVLKGLLPVDLKYYGAHTGRFSGAGGINLQNLGGRGRTGSGIDPLISDMRSLLCAPAMFNFLIVDSAQIEARLLAWIAGQEDLLDGFKKGDDIYSIFATELFGCEVRKPNTGDSESDRKKLKIRRGFGKDAILGCGYGMGAKKFYQRCRENSDLRPLFDSGEYDFKFIDNLIGTYRTTYREIICFWKKIEKMFKWVIKYPHEIMRYGSVKIEPTMSGRGCFGHDLPLIGLRKHGNTVHLRLPSGRELTYRHCRIDSKNTIQWHWGHLWGGSITENIVQAIARDLLGYWILEFEKNHLPVVLHSHDEIISLVRENDETALPQAIKLMSQGPDWAEGLPLGAEGELSKVYKK